MNLQEWLPINLTELEVLGDIHEVQTEGEGVRIRWTHADEGRGQLHVDVHTEN